MAGRAEGRRGGQGRVQEGWAGQGATYQAHSPRAQVQEAAQQVQGAKTVHLAEQHL